MQGGLDLAKLTAVEKRASLEYKAIEFVTEGRELVNCNLQSDRRPILCSNILADDREISQFVPENKLPGPRPRKPFRALPMLPNLVL